MTDFLTTGWPWAGLGVVVLLLWLLFATDLLRGDPAVPRFRDLVWLAWLMVPCYMVHQFEEHGIDLAGHAYAFRGELCAVLGYPNAATCPAPVSFITAVNLPLSWIAIPLSALLGRRRPLVALSALAVPATNAVAHIGPGILRGRYNPGLATAIMLFLPLTLWVFRLALTRYKMGRKAVALAVGSGVLCHAILLGVLLLAIRGVISEIPLDALESANVFVPVTAALAFSRKWSFSN